MLRAMKLSGIQTEAHRSLFAAVSILIILLIWPMAASAKTSLSDTVEVESGTGSSLGLLPESGGIAREANPVQAPDVKKAPKPRADSRYIEQRLELIRKSLEADETEGNEEPLIEKGSPAQEVGIPLVFNDAVEHYISYFTTTKRDVFKRWLKRKRRYAPLVRQILREHGLPEDLVYLAMIESGFNVQAYSPAKAAGPWQFIPETGRRFGLEVNHWVDERRDIRKSTVAAAKYLQELFDQFGCWYLAAAGYNAGERKIDKLIKRYDTKDFWELRAYNTLPRETREYVPQLIAAAIIAKDPEKYGLGEIEKAPPFEFVRETVPGGVPLATVAEAAAVDLSIIRSFNPEIRRGITPPGKDYRISLPVETDTTAFRSSLTALLEEGKKVVGVVRHIVGRRENVRKITGKYGVSTRDLVLVNDSPLPVRRGASIYVPRFDKQEEAEEIVLAQAEAPEPEPERQPEPTVAKRRAVTTKTVSHVVRKGETLSAIAAKYRVDVKTLKQANGLKSNRITRGMKLRLTVASEEESKEPPKKTRTVKKASPLVKAVKYKKKKAEPVPARYHLVKGGETLSEIAGKYGKSVQSIRKLNRLKGNSVQRGKRLRVS